MMNRADFFVVDTTRALHATGMRRRMTLLLRPLIRPRCLAQHARQLDVRVWESGTCSESEMNLLGTVSTWLTRYRPCAPGTSAARMWARATSRTSQYRDGIGIAFVPSSTSCADPQTGSYGAAAVTDASGQSCTCAVGSAVILPLLCAVHTPFALEGWLRMSRKQRWH